MHCYRGAIIRRHQLAGAGEAACRPAVECYRPRQTTATDANEQNNTAPYTCGGRIVTVAFCTVYKYSYLLT